MLVYLMGLTDIFAAIMLVTGLRPSLILTYTISFLFIKGIASFFGKPNFMLYIMGGADLISILLLWKGMVLGYMGTAVLFVMLFKGFISFWELKALRNVTLNVIYLFYKAFGFVIKTSKSEFANRVVNYFWFGSRKIKDRKEAIPNVGYPNYQLIKT